MPERLEILKNTFDKLMDYALVIFWALLGVTAKLSTINKHKKITTAQALATIFTGIFAGILANLICSYYKMDKNVTAAIISVSALSGENITGWILTNISEQLTKIWNRIINKK